MDPVIWLMLAHVLVLVFWVGGDLGVLAAAMVVRSSREPVPARLSAARLMRRLSLSARLALIMALPTGLSLAVMASWIALDGLWVALAWSGALGWAVLTMRAARWKGGKLLASVIADRIIRFAFAAGLAVLAVLSFTQALDWPLFVSLKILALSALAALGLLIRFALSPYEAALADLEEGYSDEIGEATISGSINHAAALIGASWVILLITAWLGFARPL